MATNTRIKLSAKTLKDELWNTLQDLKSNNIDAEQALATSSIAKAIVCVTSIQLKVAQYTGRKISTEVTNFTEN